MVRRKRKGGIKLLERFLRSPIIMIVFLFFVGFIYVGIQEGWSDNLLFYPFIIFILFYFGLMLIHNKKHPEKPIKWTSFIPYELREEDEGMQWITFKATRRVYIFYAFAIPLGILLITIFQELIPYFAIWLLVSFGAIQYLIYWFGTKKVLKEE